MKKIIKSAGRHIGRFLVRIVSVALILGLTIAMLPKVGSLVDLLFPTGNERVISSTAVLTKELKSEGKLVFAEFDESGEFLETIDLSLPFSITPTVQSVAGTYEYTISFCVDLESSALSYEGGRFLIALPDIAVASDNYEITSTQVKDFWYKADADRLEAIRQNQRAQRLASYTADAQTMDDLRQMAKEKVGAVFETLLETEFLSGQTTYEIVFTDPAS